MKNTWDEALKSIGFICLLLALSLYSLFVDRHLWDLVFVPMGAPHVSYLRLFVVELVLRMFTYRGTKGKRESQPDYTYILGQSLVYSVFVTIVWAILAHYS